MKYTFRPTLLTTLITLVIFSALLNLGFWQLNRAEFKKLLSMQYFERSQTVIDAAALNTKQENLRFFKVKLSGRFDNRHPVIVPSKTAFEVFSPFTIFGSTRAILVDRGEIRTNDPKLIPPILGEQEIKGVLDNPSEQLNVDALSSKLKQDFYPYVIISHTAETLPTANSGEVHVVYAFQWFGLSLGLLLFFIVANIRKNKSVLGSDVK